MPGTNGVATGPPTLKECRHCHRKTRGHRARGLCETCYRDPAIRERYPIGPAYRRTKALTAAQRGDIDFVAQVPPGVDPVPALAKHLGIHRNTAEARINRLAARGYLTADGAVSAITQALLDSAELWRTLPVSTNDRPRVEAMRRRIAVLAGGQP